MPIARYDLHCSWRESCSNLSNGHSKRWTMWRKSVWARYGKVYGNVYSIVYGIVYGNGIWQWVAMYGNALKRTAAQGNVVNECMCLSLSTMDPSILTWQAYRGQEAKKKYGRKQTLITLHWKINQLLKVEYNRDIGFPIVLFVPYQARGGWVTLAAL